MAVSIGLLRSGMMNIDCVYGVLADLVTRKLDLDELKEP